jgi:hypothetical protein
VISQAYGEERNVALNANAWFSFVSHGAALYQA